MIRPHIILGLGLLLLLGGSFGCSAPHDNPLDPASDRYHPPVATADLTGHVRSVHVSRIFPTTDSYSLVTELDGSDAALQDCVWVSYMGRTPIALSRTSATQWATVFAAAYFGDSHLQSEIGLPFVFHCLDLSGIQREVGPAYLFRVIEDVPRVLEPDSEDVVSPRPVLSWEPFAADFRPFYYRPAVYASAENFVFTVWTADLLPETQNSIVVPDSLADGAYYWALTVVDTFNNSSRSKEGMFTVLASAR
jgi:hypothetical protein